MINEGMMKINVYGTQVCPNCKIVTNYLDEKDVDHTYGTVGVDIEIMDLCEVVGHNVRSVPVILMNDKEVTFDELKTRLNQNEILSAGINAIEGLEL